MPFSFGIMQGRLTPTKGRGIQFFPFEEWKDEFTIAKGIGIQEIEYIVDYDRMEDNPLLTGNGGVVKSVIDDTGVVVNSVCFDYFMRRPFFKNSGIEKDTIREENKSVLLKTIDNLANVGGSLLEIPLVDSSSLKCNQEKEDFLDFLEDILKNIPDYIKIGLETDLNPVDFRGYLNGFNTNRVGANYDTGNSSGIGYYPAEELEAYGESILNIHIKDRVLGGTTKKLGTGSADFDSFFGTLARIGYQGAFIMQAARGEDGYEINEVKEQLDYVKNYLKKYKML